MTHHAWIFTACIAICLIGVALLLVWRGALVAQRSDHLPDEWPLAQRPLFTLAEREMYGRLCTALPQHIVLCKVPLVRFSQPLNPKELPYWFNLLGPLHVSFVVCTDSGRVVAAVDVERHDRSASHRVATIKQAVLTTCRIRYLKCQEDQLASSAELQLLVPKQTPDSRHASTASRSTHTARDSRATLAHAVRARRGEHHVQWYESGYHHDSFFAPDSRMDAAAGPGDGYSRSAAGRHDSSFTDYRDDEAGPPIRLGNGSWGTRRPAAPRQAAAAGFRRSSFVFDDPQLAYRRR
ncbi:MAG: hypothetical protein RIQ60_2462 [Pseudomonadota bacterium]|jgi:hypothetical protein